MLSFAVDRGLLSANPAKGVKLHPTKRRERFLSAEEMARLGEALAQAELKSDAAPSVAAIRLLILTGCRKGEILSLRWSYVDQERGLLRLPDSKTGAKVVPIGGPALDLLKALPRFPDEPNVFPSPRHARHLVGLQKVWERVRDAAKLENVRLHDLRHSFASIAVTGGHSLYMVSKILGHKDTRTTEIYAHLAADPMREVANHTASVIADMLKAKPKRLLEAAE
jgi:integrase